MRLGGAGSPRAGASEARSDHAGRVEVGVKDGEEGRVTGEAILGEERADAGREREGEAGGEAGGVGVCDGYDLASGEDGTSGL